MEVLEKTGINLEIDDMHEPFLIYRYYNKNHYGTGVKCLSTINYCCVKTNILFDLNHQKLDVNESKKDFVLEYIDLEETPKVLLNSASTPEQKTLAREMIDVIHFLRTKSKILRKKIKGGCNE